MRDELARIDWRARLSGLCASEAWYTFKIALNYVQSSCIPMKVKRSRMKDNLPWLTLDIRNAIRHKNAAFKAMKSSGLESTKRYYQKCSNLLKKQIRTSTGVKELDLARNCHGDSKVFQFL